eukprot:363747-Chlamydomonas_euryale.AAC.15
MQMRQPHAAIMHACRTGPCSYCIVPARVKRLLPGWLMSRMCGMRVACMTQTSHAWSGCCMHGESAAYMEWLLHAWSDRRMCEVAITCTEWLSYVKSGCHM